MTGTMRAQVFYEAKTMRMEEKQIPQLRDDELLVRVKVCAICGSDMAYYYGNSPLGTADGKGPLVLGHEISGEVVEMGAQAAAFFRKGDRIAVNPVQQCNSCEYCLRGEINVCEHPETVGVSVDGGMAEYVKLRYTHACRLPDSVSFEEGALVEPLACAVHGMERLDVKLGQDVVIFGPGPIGLMMVQLAKASGAGRVVMVGRRDYPLRMALQLGADFVVNTSDAASEFYAPEIRAAVLEKLGRLAPRAIVMTSNVAAIESALAVTGPRSTLVCFGLPGDKDVLRVPMLDAVTMERTIKGSSLAPFVWDDVMRIIAAGQVQLKPLITHRFPLEEAEAGVRFMKEGREDKIKGVIIVG